MEIEPTEFAEIYSVKERIRIVAWATIAGSIVILVCQLYFFPWLKQFASDSPCLEVLGINGFAVLIYGLFVGIPLSAGILVGFIFGYECYKILRDDQFPPIGQKVTRPTKIKRGKQAQLVAYLHLLPSILFFAVAIWGATQAQSFASLTKAKIGSYCAAKINQ